MSKRAQPTNWLDAEFADAVDVVELVVAEVVTLGPYILEPLIEPYIAVLADDPDDAVVVATLLSDETRRWSQSGIRSAVVTANKLVIVVEKSVAAKSIFPLLPGNAISNNWLGWLLSHV